MLEKSEPAGGYHGVVAPDRATLFLFLGIVGALTLVRIIGLAFNATDLYFDESQYWAWSQEPAFGYFSKPPLIAWIIGAADLVCGGSEACIRAPAPLLYAGMAVFVFLAADRLYGDGPAFWAGIVALLAPGIVYSSRIISTDVPLLFFWSAALYAYVRLLTAGDSRWAVLLGAAFGLGLLAKYAMIYFVLCALVAAIVDRRARYLLSFWPLWAAFGGGLLFLVPNVVWNVQHGLITFFHTGRNIAGRGFHFDVENGLSFIAAQFGIGGPIIVAALLMIAFRVRDPDEVSPDDRVMLAFSLPVLAAVTLFAFVAGANGNWAAPAFVSAFIVATAALIRMRRINLVIFSVALGFVVQAILLVSDAVADRFTLPGAGDVYERTLGWRPVGDEVAAAAKRTGARSILAENRREVSAILYYGRDAGLPVYTWPAPTRRGPNDHFELTRPLVADAPKPILVVSLCPEGERLGARFDSVEPIGSFAAASGATTSRTYYVYLVDGATSAEPPPACGRS